MASFVKPFIVLMFLPLVVCGCGEQQPGYDATEAEGQPSKTKTAAESVALGEITFKAQCVLCHGADGKQGTSGAKDLSASTLSEQDAINIVSYGRGSMMAYKGLLTGEQIEDVVAYIQTLRKK